MKFFLSLAMLFTAAGVAASVFDARTRSMIAVRGADHSSLRLSAPDATPSYFPLLVRLADAADLTPLESADAVIWGQRDDIVICCVPADNLHLIADSDGIVIASAATPLASVCDKALPAARADRLVTPDGNLLDGNGVVAGLCDIGFDATHPAFGDRIGMMAVINEREASLELLTATPSIAARVTDNPDECHATHVAAIMAGAECDNGLHGVAPSATVAATMSTLTDVGLLAGMERIIEFARSEGKPAVINASVGSYTGPHDGTSLFNTYLSRLADDAIVCMSAGNNGTYPGSITATIGSEGFIGTAITTWDNFSPQGYLDIWSDTAEPLTVSFGIYDSDTDSWILDTPPCGTGLRDSWILTDRPSEMAESGRIVASYPDFDRLFSGYVAADGEPDPLNGRYHIAVSFNYVTDIASANGKWGRYLIAARIHGREGQRVAAFSEGVRTRLGSIPRPGFRAGDSRTSISDLVCGSGVISVGMTVSRNSYPLADGSEFENTAYTAGTVCSHSSYGMSRSRGLLPDICAPGWYVLSALSRPYREAHPDAYPIAALDSEGLYAWTAMGGTSMSSPLVAGVIAAWLQAVPDLKTDEALEILRLSARKDMADASDPRYGASGLIDAEAGLRMLLGRQNAAIGRPAADDATVRTEGETVTCSNPDTPMLLYSAQGKAVAAGRGTLRLSGLPTGIYILHAGTSLPQKIVVNQSTLR